jgi:hypothetical protein
MESMGGVDAWEEDDDSSSGADVQTHRRQTHNSGTHFPPLPQQSLLLSTTPVTSGVSLSVSSIMSLRPHPASLVIYLVPIARPYDEKPA